ncbi:MAG: metal-dependent transcriptional regulator [Archaeoglobaceae archaeon]|nr:metal-dependent transcriptional regulator [Archaeoglobaceae archaeon]MCX8151612.1 metal-dependent transcriptional regulator [Archaeoglobaceae archaeon]MDW8013110.1 metal-dependent transcriptional regulator [Archaeoglobaceae archaeon]
MRTVFLMRKVYELWNEDCIVTPSKLAEKLSVSKSTAHKILLSISKKGFGRYIERKGLILNEEGIKIAKKALRTHRLLECMLQEIGVENVCFEAEKIEDNIGEGLLKTLEEKYGKRRICPCGKYIP